jgi:hypothetical protein
MEPLTSIRSEVIEGVGSAMVYTTWIVDWSPAVVGHFNRIGAAQQGSRTGVFVPFEPGTYLGLSLPLQPLPIESGVRQYLNLTVVVDERFSFRLGDYPRFPSVVPHRLDLFRGGPTLVPVDRFPEGFFGEYHSVSLLEDGKRIFGPAQRFFPSRESGVRYHSLDDGDGKLVAHLTNVDLFALSGNGVNPKPLIPILTDPVFGEPVRATEILPNGERYNLPYQLIGHDYIGDTYIFNEGVLWDIVGTPGDALIEIEFPNAASGFACILHGGYSEARANRAGATVR